MKKFLPAAFRRWLRHARRGHKPVILMYHRINDKGEDPSAIAVSPRHFAEHLEVLRRFRRIVSLRELAKSLAVGDPIRDAAVVTFDDGYADNLHVAKPLLEHYETPATVFIATGAVGSMTEFWWDELGRILLQPSPLPARLRVELSGLAHEWELGTASGYFSVDDARQQWRYWEKPPTERHAIYSALRQLLKPLPAGEQSRILENLRRWAELSPTARPDRRSLSVADLTRLVEGGLIDLGVHSVTHPPLPGLPLDALEHQIKQSKSFLEQCVGRPVEGFAYPFGEFDDATVDAVSRAGFSYACTIEEEVVRKRTDPFRLPRFAVKDWDGEEFERRLVARFAIN